MGDLYYKATHIDKRRAAARSYYAAHREKRREYSRAWRTKNPAQAMYVEWRSLGCMVCGEREVLVVEGHHVDPTEKKHGLSQIRDSEIMANELAKCVQLCRNDHTRVHDALHYSHKGGTTEEVIAYLRERRHSTMSIPAS